MYYERAKMNKILSNIYNVITIKGVSFVPTNVRAWALKIPLSQKSRYLGTCVLTRYLCPVYFYFVES